MTEKLKPCPFCGEHAYISKYWSPYTVRYSVEIGCSNCSDDEQHEVGDSENCCWVGPSIRVVGCTEIETQNKAIEIWNTRMGE